MNMETLIYDLLTYLIIGLAVLVVMKKIFRKSFSKNEEASCADGCGGCTSKCDLKEIAAQNK